MTPGPSRRDPAQPPLNRMAVAVLALLGLFVSLYLLAHSLGLTGPLVCGVGDCATVQASPYAWVGPMPVSGIGVVGYAVLLGLALLGLQVGRLGSSGVALGLLAGSLVGLGFSAYLTYLEAVVIRAWCQWCVVSAVLMTLIFLAALPELRRLGSGTADTGGAVGE